MSRHTAHDRRWKTESPFLGDDTPHDLVAARLSVEVDSDRHVEEGYVTLYTHTPEFPGAEVPVTFDVAQVHLSPNRARQVAAYLEVLADTLDHELGNGATRRVHGWRWKCGSCGLTMLVDKEPRNHDTDCPRCHDAKTETPWEHADWTEAT